MLADRRRVLVLLAGTLATPTGNAGYESDPLFSPDGTHVAYLRSSGDNQINLTEAFVSPAAGGAAIPVSHPADRAVHQVAWLPDGSALLFAVHDGTLGADAVEPTAHAGVSARELRAALAAGLSPDPRRAAALTGVVERHGRLVLGECWPDVALVACWLGGSAGIQARHLDAHFGPGVARRDLGLVASEGRLTIPVDDRSAAGVLTVHENFFEFVPEEAMEDPAPRTLLCHELEVGRRYYVVVTGANGLYRYDLNPHTITAQRRYAFEPPLVLVSGHGMR